MNVKFRFGFRLSFSGEGHGRERQAEQPSAETGERKERPDRRAIEGKVHAEGYGALPAWWIAAQDQPGRKDQGGEVIEVDIGAHQHAGDQADGNGSRRVTTTAAPEDQDGSCKDGGDSKAATGSGSWRGSEDWIGPGTLLTIWSEWDICWKIPVPVASSVIAASGTLTASQARNTRP